MVVIIRNDGKITTRILMTVEEDGNTERNQDNHLLQEARAFFAKIYDK